MSAGTLVPPGSTLLAVRNRTLAEHAPVFLKWLQFVRQRRENTVLSYKEDLKTFLGFCAQAELSQPDDVSFRHIEFYLGWLQQERGLKASSANRHLHALRTFWKWMVREEIAARNPAADVFMLPTRRRAVPPVARETRCAAMLEGAPGAVAVRFMVPSRAR